MLNVTVVLVVSRISSLKYSIVLSVFATITLYPTIVFPPLSIGATQENTISLSFSITDNGFGASGLAYGFIVS